MSKYFFSGVLGSALFISQAAFGAFSIDELHVASKEATTTFARINPDHVEHFVGFKAWKSGEDAKVKVYVDHGGMSMEFNYLCHKHDDEVECHEQ